MSMLGIIGGLAGGLGLFLLAIHMITEGLKAAAGTSLRRVLNRWTNTPGRGLLFGITITALVQSSSAVTVAAIGFVNAGLLTLWQTLGVVFGANVGTTMTGWLVAAVGFEIKISLFALPLIGAGMLLRLTGPGTRRGALGEALAGFGLFFIGIDALQTAFAGMAAQFDIGSLSTRGLAGMPLYLGMGFIMTVLTQSSSAALAIVLTAATGGVLALPAAAAMIVGANVGTTSTAGLAVIGATPNAKRVAAAHIVFNLLTGVVALALLPVLLSLAQAAGRTLGLADAPAVSLALFHTVFNVLGVLLMWPLAGRLAAWLATRFRTAEEIEAQPRYLDRTMLATPALAVDAFGMELGRVAAIAQDMAQAALSAEGVQTDRLRRDRTTLERLLMTIGDYVTRIQRGSLSAETAEQLPIVLRTGQYFSAVSDLAIAVAGTQEGLSPVTDPELLDQLNRFKADAAKLLEQAGPEAEWALQYSDLLDDVQRHYQLLKSALLRLGAEGRIKIDQMNTLLEQVSRIRRLTEQIVKGSGHLAWLRQRKDELTDDDAEEVDGD